MRHRWERWVQNWKTRSSRQVDHKWTAAQYRSSRDTEWKRARKQKHFTRLIFILLLFSTLTHDYIFPKMNCFSPCKCLFWSQLHTEHEEILTWSITTIRAYQAVLHRESVFTGSECGSAITAGQANTSSHPLTRLFFATHSAATVQTPF